MTIRLTSAKATILPEQVHPGQIASKYGDARRPFMKVQYDACNIHWVCLESGTDEGKEYDADIFPEDEPVFVFSIDEIVVASVNPRRL